MKKLCIALFSLITLTVAAQNTNYEKAMQQNLQLLGTSKTAEDYTDVAAAFERIADAEKTQWLPYYYAAFSKVMMAYNAPADEKDAICNAIDILIDKAAALDNNSEIYCLKQMVATNRMMVDPMSRWQTYGSAAGQALETAKKMDPNNPRVYYLEGQTLFNTPAAFGGGKDKAKPLFEKAAALYEQAKPATAMHPTWGKQQNNAMLEKCK
jgi:hypothetical protein